MRMVVDHPEWRSTIQAQGRCLMLMIIFDLGNNDEDRPSSTKNDPPATFFNSASKIIKQTSGTGRCHSVLPGRLLHHKTIVKRREADIKRLSAVYLRYG